MPSDTAPSPLAPAPAQRAGGGLRIAMVAACPYPCGRGTPVRIDRMAGALARRGHDVHVVTYHLAEGEPEPGVTVHRTPAVPTYRRIRPGPSWQKVLVMDPLLGRVLRRVLAGGRFDVVHAHHFEGLGVALLVAPAGVPVVFDAHTLLDSELPYYRLGLPRRLLRGVGRVLDCALPARADHVVSVTPDIRDRLVARCGMPADRVTVVENGVMWELFDVAGVPREPTTVVFAGNLAPYQGVEPMLRAFQRLRRTHPDARLVLATEDVAGLRPYRALADELGLSDHLSVRPTPFEELPRVLAGATVALNPRLACDGMPMKVQNYMAAGVPVVSFAGSAKGLEHERTAWIVPDGEVDAFAAGIARLLDDPRLARRLGDGARAAVRAGGSWDRVAERVEAIYRGLPGERRGRGG